MMPTVLTVDDLIAIIRDELEWSVDSATSETPLGQDGLGLESMFMVELGLILEERFGYLSEESEILSLMTMRLGEIVDFVTVRANRGR